MVVMPMPMPIVFIPFMPIVFMPMAGWNGGCCVVTGSVETGGGSGGRGCTAAALGRREGWPGGCGVCACVCVCVCV